METDAAIDRKLPSEAREVSGLKTEIEIINLALREFVNRRMQLEIIDLFGKMEPDPDHATKGEKVEHYSQKPS